MIILTENDLPKLVSCLEHKFPRSLAVYYLAKFRVEKRCYWPGLDFVVDKFPEPSVCIVRPAPDSTDFVPLINGYSVFSFSNDAAAFRDLLKEKGLIDWTKRILFPAVHRPDESRALRQHCEEAELGTAVDYQISETFIPRGVFLRFDLTNLPSFEYSLPPGLKLGVLQPEHGSRLAVEKQYGNLPANRMYFRYIIENDFPNVCVYNEKNLPIAYLLQKPEGCLGAGYVAPEYRCMGLFKIVTIELLKKLRDLGETYVYADVMVKNKYSLRALQKVGGVLYDNFDADWIEFLPFEK